MRFVLSPVMPTWDEGAFIAPLTGHFLSAGYRVVVFDSLSIPVACGETLNTFSERWAELLQPWGVPDVLVGVALGGALALELVRTSSLASTAALLLLSSQPKPTLYWMPGLEEWRNLHSLATLKRPSVCWMHSSYPKANTPSKVQKPKTVFILKYRAAPLRWVWVVSRYRSQSQSAGIPRKGSERFGERSQLVNQPHVVRTSEPTNAHCA